MSDTQNLATGPQPPAPEETPAARAARSKALAYYVARRAQKKRLGVIPTGR